MQRFGVDEGRVLSALVFDQDTLNDLLMSTSIGSSIAPLAMRGSNMSRIPEVSGRAGSPVNSQLDARPIESVGLSIACLTYSLRTVHYCVQRNSTVATVALPEDWAARLRHESGESFGRPDMLHDTGMTVPCPSVSAFNSQCRICFEASASVCT